MKLIGLRFCLALLLVLGWAVASQALQPPTEEQIEQYKKDGSWAERVRNAYAIGNHKIAPELAARANYKLRRLAYQAAGKTAEEVNQVLPAPPSAWQGMPSTGNVKMFVLLIEFSDYPHIAGDDQTAVDSRIFGLEDTGSINYPYESLTAYYNRSSYGLLNLQGATLGWYNAGKRSDVAETDAGREDLIKKAVKNFDDNGHDFSQYDNDGDGDIDYFAVIWTGPHGEWATFWWSYVPDSGFTDSSYTVDGKILGNYSWQWESSSYPSGSFNPLVLIHETGHAIGLPDYYDYDDNEDDGVIKGPNGGVGGLDMMDSNLGDHNAFSKFVLDWLTPTVISATGTYPGQILSSSANAADALLIMPNASTSPFGEFFMAQHRKREKNDADIPTDGLLIWHVDARLNAAGTDYLYNNSSTAHKLLRLMEADGLEEIETGATIPDRQVDAGDFYINGKSFTETSTPNSNAYSSFATGVQVTNIADTGNDITCDVAINKVVRSAHIAAGGYHTVFIRSDGSLWAWGLNRSGQLGNATIENRNSPVRIGTDSNWMTIAAGREHTVAVKTDGSLWAWGYNANGQLGDGTTENKSTPTRIGTDSDWLAVASGREHSVAVKTNGSLWTWGYNVNGQLGNGITESRNSPVRIGVDSNWMAVAAGGFHTLAVKTDGSLWACGNNLYGQLGDGTTENKSTLTRSGTASNWKAVTAGTYHTAAVNTDGYLWAWGNNYYGQLGDGTTTDKTSPMQIGTGNNFQAVAAGSFHIVSLNNNGKISSCGNNLHGQIGDGTTENRHRPVQIGADSDWQTISAGIFHTVAMKKDGNLWAWGYNVNGQLGDGTTTGRQTPVPVIFLSSNDTDSDGIDDSWEMTYFHNLTTANATSDADKDGYSDKQEYLNLLANETDPVGTVYDPTAKNIPGGTGYVAPIPVVLPAIYKLLLKH